jgi:hypothetical protein
MCLSYLELAQHPCISQSVGLYTGKIQEFSNTLIVGKDELCIGFWVNNGVRNFNKSVASEEVDLESQANRPRPRSLASQQDVPSKSADAFASQVSSTARYESL